MYTILSVQNSYWIYVFKLYMQTVQHCCVYTIYIHSIIIYMSPPEGILLAERVPAGLNLTGAAEWIQGRTQTFRTNI